ncbi:hypothetical protein BLA29_010315, partial [Euroglyphus maynei]
MNIVHETCHNIMAEIFKNYSTEVNSLQKNLDKCSYELADVQWPNNKCTELVISSENLDLIRKKIDNQNSEDSNYYHNPCGYYDEELEMMMDYELDDEN